MSVLEYSDVFKRKIRSGTFEALQVSTYQKINEAIRDRNISDAIEYIDFFDVEAKVCYDLYEQWNTDTKRFLLDKGMSEEDFQGISDDLCLLVNHDVEPGVPYDKEAELRRYKMYQHRLVRLLNAPYEIAIQHLEAWKELWRTIHDRDVDYVSGLFNVVHIRHGEESIEEMYRDYVIGNLFNFRYERFDVSKNDWNEVYNSLLYVTMEAMRGHLFGPQREGTFEVKELEDRVEMSFTPCGSGGRLSEGDKIKGTASRHEAPYYYLPMQKEHNFSWNKKGVCHYCVHCSVLMEQLPMEKFGYPVRVVEPPVYPDNNSRCTYIMYRDPRKVPDTVYKRRGMEKPPSHAPLGSKGANERKQIIEK